MSGSSTPSPLRTGFSVVRTCLTWSLGTYAPNSRVKASHLHQFGFRFIAGVSSLMRLRTMNSAFLFLEPNIFCRQYLLLELQLHSLVVSSYGCSIYPLCCLDRQVLTALQTRLEHVGGIWTVGSHLDELHIEFDDLEAVSYRERAPNNKLRCLFSFRSLSCFLPEECRCFMKSYQVPGGIGVKQLGVCVREILGYVYFWIRAFIRFVPISVALA